MPADRPDPADPKSRFSSRVDAYVKYRPGYPPDVLELFRREMGLTPDSVVADVGSGTGISAEPFLGAGCTVFGIEPNAAMRATAEALLAGHPRFRSIEGSAEATTLPDASVDLVLCAQAFHWFDRGQARAEFARVLRPGGFVALVWNARKKTSTAFLEGYEALLHQYGTDYARVDHEAITDEEICAFLGPTTRRASFPNEQRFDLAGLRGRVASSSYTPAPGQPGYAELMAGLDDLFLRCSEAGHVVFTYDTEVYWAPAPEKS